MHTFQFTVHLYDYEHANLYFAKLYFFDNFVSTKTYFL